MLHSSIRKNDVNFDARLKELSYYFNQPIRAGEKYPALTLVSRLEAMCYMWDPALNPGALFGAGGAPIATGRAIEPGAYPGAGL